MGSQESCPFRPCTLQFNTKEDLQAHVVLAHTCRHCKKTVAEWDSLQTHLLTCDFVKNRTPPPIVAFSDQKSEVDSDADRKAIYDFKIQSTQSLKSLGANAASTSACAEAGLYLLHGNAVQSQAIGYLLSAGVLAHPPKGGHAAFRQIALGSQRYKSQFEILGEVDGSMQNTASMLQIFRRMHSHSNFYDSATVLNGTSGDCSVLLYFAQSLIWVFDPLERTGPAAVAAPGKQAAPSTKRGAAFLRFSQLRHAMLFLGALFPLVSVGNEQADAMLNSFTLTAFRLRPDQTFVPLLAKGSGSEPATSASSSATSDSAKEHKESKREVKAAPAEQASSPQQQQQQQQPQQQSPAFAQAQKLIEEQHALIEQLQREKTELASRLHFELRIKQELRNYVSRLEGQVAAASKTG